MIKAMFWKKPVLTNILAKFGSCFSVDLRSLALMRIGVGAVLLIDLLFRLQYVNIFYSDTGLLSRSTAIAKLNPQLISLHLANGSEYFQFFLIFLQIAISLCLIVGYKTRIVTFLSWILYISLFSRNPYINYGADFLLLYLLLLGIFLPWGARFSLDQPSYKNTSSVLSAASWAYIFHIMMLYGFAGLNKSLAAGWQSGNAIFYTLSFAPFHKPMADLLLFFYPVTILINYATLLLELIVPFLLIIPFFVPRIRLFLVISLILLHLGIDLGIEIGIFSWVSMVGLFGLLPSLFWNKMQQNSLFVSFSSVNQIIIFSIIQILMFIKRYLEFSSSILVIILSVYLFIINVNNVLNIEKYLPKNIFAASKIIHIPPPWDMFADISNNYTWISISGSSSSNQNINLLAPAEPFTVNNPTYSSWLYQDHRWKKYMYFIHNGLLTPNLARYICNQWNISSSQNLTSISFFLTDLHYDLQKKTDLKSKLIYKTSCFK